MPFTPLHFGYGALFHSFSPARVSFLAFCAVNVVIDLEPLYWMVTGQYPIHRFFHTLLGASLAASLVAAAHCLTTRARVRARLPDVFGWKSLSATAVALGAVLGAYSHLALDAVMHDDLRPLHPLTDANPLLHIVSIDWLNLSCLVAALLAGALLGWTRLVRRAMRGR